mmetsp:Transcript_2601/g.4569  ORF Transcript_2601/g.4569 Transcript_2601/m.4569 type:complete len:504 (-) Transcript_2601:1343-2854(-)
MTENGTGEGDAKMLVEYALKNVSDADKEMEYIGGLRRISQNADVRADAVDAGGIECVTQVLQFHSMNATLQAVGIEFLSNVAQLGEPAIARMLQAKTFLTVISSMGRLSSDVNVQTWSCVLFKHSASLSPLACDVLVQNGGVDALCAAMNAFTGHSNIQSQCCECLLPLSASGVDAQNRIRSASGIPTILQTMQAYASSPALQEAVIKILTNLSKKNETNQQVIGDEGGVELILSSMRENESHQGVLLAGCQAFRFLGFSRENRTRIGDADGIQVLVDSMRHLQNSPGAMDHVLKALNNSTFDNIPNKTAAGRCGGIQVTVELMDANRSLAEMQEDGCRLLRNLAEGVDLNRRIISDVGGINTILFAMTTHPNHMGISEHGSAALLILAKSDMLLSNVKADDVSRLLESRLELHRENLEFQRYAKELLEILDDDTRVRNRSRTGSRAGRASSRTASRLGASSRTEEFSSNALRNRSRSKTLRSKSRDESGAKKKGIFSFFSKK